MPFRLILALRRAEKNRSWLMNSPITLDAIRPFHGCRVASAVRRLRVGRFRESLGSGEYRRTPKNTLETPMFLKAVGLASVAAVAVAIPAAAHHSFAMFDALKIVQLEGTG